MMNDDDIVFFIYMTEDDLNTCSDKRKLVRKMVEKFYDQITIYENITELINATADMAHQARHGAQSYVEYTGNSLKELMETELGINEEDD